ncbi:MAG: hypothetical protein AB4911_21460 [Oscillochloridaceae bacterium umkhey_bin13]
MSHTIIDTNAAVVANGNSAQASQRCAAACERLLQEFTADRRRLVIDSSWHILREYIRNLRSEGQPGAGDAFLRWVLTNQANPQRCEQVAITTRPDAQSEHDFAEFPDDPALERFDPSDRKFVAVARAHPEHPPIHYAIERGWYRYQAALASHGLTIIQVCPDDMQRGMAG